MMKIYTKTGDKGETSLFGGKRVLKNDLRIKAYGTSDELNSYIGLAITEINSEEIKKILIIIQNNLFILGTMLATPSENFKKLKDFRFLGNKEVTFIEEMIDNLDCKLENLKNFIIPGGSKGSALLHIARTVCRRCEREVISLMKEEEIDGNILIYLNRLSDFLFVAARYENKINNINDVLWQV